MITLQLILILAAIIISEQSYPVVVFHGMGDACANPGMKSFTETFAKKLNVYSVCIESGPSGDSISINLNEQAKLACNIINQDEKIIGNISVVGLSQGSLLARTVIQQCKFNGQVMRYISIGGPQLGVATLPKCHDRTYICEFMNRIADELVYTEYIQQHIGPAGYFNNPKNYTQYLKYASFLPFYNNENQIDLDMKNRFSQLEKVVLTMFEKDTMIDPPSTAWFQFYLPDGKTVVPVNQTRLYNEDLIGLKTLILNNKVQFVALPGDHLRFTQEDIDKYFIPALQ